MEPEQEREFVLEPLQEFRFEVDTKEKITIKVVAGKAEIFGTELANNVEYNFKGKKLAVFTWHGCTIISSGKNVSSEYIGYETPMEMQINVHFALEELRKNAKELDQIGPRVMIVGPADVGKTSLAKTLIGYAARNATNTTLVDIDPEEVFSFNVGFGVTSWYGLCFCDASPFGRRGRIQCIG